MGNVEERNQRRIEYMKRERFIVHIIQIKLSVLLVLILKGKGNRKLKTMM